MAAIQLPVEVVTHIMSFLNVADRKDAALVCRTWLEASLDPILQRDIIIHFYASCSAFTDKTLLSLSRRRLPHLVLNDMDSSLDDKLVFLKSCEHLAANLKTLSLRRSNITEKTFVELLSSCKNLVSLDLSSCNSLFMSGSLLEKNSEMQILKNTLTNVIEVDLSSIRYLSDATFNRIVTVCENVEKLSFASTQISFKGHEYIHESNHVANSTVLTYKNILNFIASQKCLKSLNFSRTLIEDCHIEELVLSLKLHLQELFLLGCRNVSDEGISIICKHQPHLVSLDVSECPDLTNKSVMVIAMTMKLLKNLYLNKCKQLTDSAAANLSNLKHLQVLDLSECFQITSDGLIKGLCVDEAVTSHITNLNLNCCSGITDNFVEKACDCLPLLTNLDLASCFNITDRSVHAISRRLKYLQYLRLAWCIQITDLGLMGLLSDEHDHIQQHVDGICKCTRKNSSTIIFKKPTDKKKKESAEDVKRNSINSGLIPVALSSLTGLRYLDLGNCKQLTDTSLVHVIKFPELKFLSLCMIPNLTDDGIIQIVRNNPSIEELNISQCAMLTDAAMETVTRHLQRLQTLNVFGCDKLTDKTVRYLQTYCSRLRNLDVSFCGGISHDAMEKLENNMSSLLKVHMRMIGSSDN